MVRCMLKRKVYEICSDDEYGGGLKCMMNGVICYPGADNVLEAEARREMRAAVWSTKIIEEDFDDLGRARLKIVYVDEGPTASDSVAKEASKHIKTIIKAEKEKEKKEGRRRPRLIFVRQDRDYWPGSEKDPEVMDRRAAKERSKPDGLRPDYRSIFVGPMPEDEKEIPLYFADSNARKAYNEEAYKRDFMRYFDPSMPGTQFILDNLPPTQLYSVINEYKEDPDLWKEWMRLSSQHDQKPAVNRSSEGTGDMCITT